MKKFPTNFSEKLQKLYQRKWFVTIFIETPAPTIS